MARSYKESWDGYWREVTPRPGVAFWDYFLFHRAA